jgi:hypothetical protein
MYIREMILARTEAAAEIQYIMMHETTRKTVFDLPATVDKSFRCGLFIRSLSAVFVHEGRKHRQQLNAKLIAHIHTASSVHIP